MSRKNKEWLKGIQHMAIAKRITLLYGGIFSLSLLFISGFMMLNISGLQQSEMRRELQETMTQVQEFLQTNTDLSDESLRELLGDKYVEISIYSSEANETYNNFVGEMPAVSVSSRRGASEQAKAAERRGQAACDWRE